MATRKTGKMKRPATAARAAGAKAHAGRKVASSTKRASSGKKATSRRTTTAATSAGWVERRRGNPETLRLRSIEPSLTVNDLQQSLKFYTDVLGFIVGEKWERDGVLRGVSLKAGVCELTLTQDDWAKGRDRKKGEGVRIMGQTVQEVDSLAARIKAAGGNLTQEPQDQSWGARTLSIDDPDGYHVTIYKMQ